MKAAPEVQERLIALQQHDSKSLQLRTQAKRLPEHAEITARREAQRARGTEIAALLGAVEDTQRELDRVTSDTASVELRLKADEAKLAAETSARTAQALGGEVAQLRVRRDRLDDRALELGERLDTARAAYAAALAADAEHTRVTDELAAARDARLAELREAHAREQEARKALAAELPAELLALYERLRERYGIGAARLWRGVSKGSNVELTREQLEQVRQAAPDDVVLCPDSGVILVRNDASFPETPNEGRADTVQFR